MLPHDMPLQLGKLVQLVHYVHANIFLDAFTRRSFTACLHFVIGTTIDWYTRKQTTIGQKRMDQH